MKSIFITALVGVTALGLRGQSAITNSWTLTPSAGIPDGNPVGLTETFSVTGLSGAITDVQLGLNITDGFNGDLYAYLVNPTGQLAVLLNRPGLSGGNPVGYSDAGMNITLDANATDNIHYYQTVLNPNGGSLSGIWAADGRNIDPQSSGSVFDSTLPTAGLNVYSGLNGVDLNGTWTLFIADMTAGGGSPSLDSTTLSIITAPEPPTQALAVSGGVLIWLFTRKLRRAHQKNR